MGRDDYCYDYLEFEDSSPMQLTSLFRQKAAIQRSTILAGTVKAQAPTVASGHVMGYASDTGFTNAKENEMAGPNRITSLQQQIETLALRVSELAKWGTDSDHDEGTILVIDKVHHVEAYLNGDQDVVVFRYVGVKINRAWYLTGIHNVNAKYTWDQFVDFLNDGLVINVEKVTKTKALYKGVTAANRRDEADEDDEA